MNSNTYFQRYILLKQQDTLLGQQVKSEKSSILEEHLVRSEHRILGIQYDFKPPGANTLSKKQPGKTLITITGILQLWNNSHFTYQSKRSQPLTGS